MITIFILLIVIISLFLPSSFQLERSIVINADKEQVFTQVQDLKNWKNWSPWVLKDEEIYLDEDAYSSPSNIAGATFSWNSDNQDIGVGVLELKKVEKYSLLETQTDLGFIVPEDEWLFADIDSGVEVTWSTKIDFGFNPISKFYGLFLKDKMAPDYELGLKKLKDFTEELPKIHQVRVVKDSVEASWFLSIRDSVNHAEMNNIHGKIYAQINRYMDNNETEMNGSPLVIYHFWSDTLIDIEAGIPIKDSVEINDDEIRLQKIKKGNVVTATHYGSYERLPETYFGINEWMRKNKVVVTGAPWEVYITDPAIESNPDKWETAIYFPIN